MPVERLLPTDEAADLLALTRELADKEVLPLAAEGERTATPPRDLFRTLGEAGLLALPYPEEFGGADQPYEVYLQVLEELALEAADVLDRDVVELARRDLEHEAQRRRRRRGHGVAGRAATTARGPTPPCRTPG